jgi:hypothetical protein
VLCRSCDKFRQVKTRTTFHHSAGSSDGRYKHVTRHRIPRPRQTDGRSRDACSSCADSIFNSRTSHSLPLYHIRTDTCASTRTHSESPSRGFRTSSPRPRNTNNEPRSPRRNHQPTPPALPNRHDALPTSGNPSQSRYQRLEHLDAVVCDVYDE